MTDFEADRFEAAMNEVSDMDSEGVVWCIECLRPVPKEAFSSTQLKKKKDKAKCRECVEALEQAAAATRDLAPTSVDDEKLRVLLNSMDGMISGGRDLVGAPLLPPEAADRSAVAGEKLWEWANAWYPPCLSGGEFSRKYPEAGDPSLAEAMPDMLPWMIAFVAHAREHVAPVWFLLDEHPYTAGLREFGDSLNSDIEFGDHVAFAKLPSTAVLEGDVKITDAPIDGVLLFVELDGRFCLFGS